MLNSLPLEKAIQAPRSDGLFSSMVFALSFEDAKVRERISDLVRDNGGVILEQSFQDLVEENLVVKAAFREVVFTALLAVKHSRKEKYMQELALGLPCLSGKWVDASIKSNSQVYEQPSKASSYAPVSPVAPPPSSSSAVYSPIPVSSAAPEPASSSSAPGNGYQPISIPSAAPTTSTTPTSSATPTSSVTPTTSAIPTTSAAPTRPSNRNPRTLRPTNPTT